MAHKAFLKKREHLSTMMTKLNMMRKDRDLCDFIIKVESDEYHVHKNILAAGSEYFRAMLKYDTKESREGMVTMLSVNSECVKSCIDYIYTAELAFPDGKINALIHVAALMQLDRALKCATEHLEDLWTGKNYYSTKRAADAYGVNSILARCKVFFEDNIMDISTNQEFQDEEKSCVLSILTSAKRLRLTDEDKLLLALRWVGNKTESEKNLLEFLQHINFRKVSVEYLGRIKNHSVFNDKPGLWKLVNSAILRNSSESETKEIDNRSQSLILFDILKDCLHSYDPYTNDLTIFHENYQHISSRKFSAVTLDACIYILRQDKAVYRLNCLRKEPKWERTPNMIGSHGKSPPVVALSGSLFVIGHGGGHHSSPSSCVEQFCASTCRWARLNDKPQPISDTALVAVGESIYCVGGVNAPFCKFIPPSQWITLDPLPTPRKKCAAVAVEQKIYVMGGTRYTWQTAVECYDVNSHQWSVLEPTLREHGCGKAYHVDGWIYLVSEQCSIFGVEKYDITNNRWCSVVIKKPTYDTISNSVLLNRNAEVSTSEHARK